MMIGKCPCCGEEVIVEFHQAKWIVGNDRVVVIHKKWIGPLEPKGSLDKINNVKYNSSKYVRR